MVGLDIFGLEEYFHLVTVQHFVYASHRSSENKQAPSPTVDLLLSVYFKIPAQ